MKEISNFLEEYLKITETLESPTSFLYWGAISCISAVLRDNVWYVKPPSLSKVFVNTYIILLADSSNIRKSNAIGINKSLLRGPRGVSNTKVMAGSATMQAILKNLAEAETGAPKGGSGIALASELEGYFIQDAQTVGTLCDIYDFHEMYDKKLASYDIPDIKNLCFSLFGASNVEMMQSLIDPRATKGGLIARTILIEEKERRLIDSGFEEHGNYADLTDWDPMVKYLKGLSAVPKGVINFEQDGQRYFTDWYHALAEQNIKTGTGYEGRLPTHALKVGACIAASKKGFSEDRTVRKDDIMCGIKLCENLLPKYTEISLGTGARDGSHQLKKVVQNLVQAKEFKMSRMQLLGKLYVDMSGEELDKICADLVQAGFARDTYLNGIMGWQLTEKFLNEYSLNKQKYKSQAAS